MVFIFKKVCRLNWVLFILPGDSVIVILGINKIHTLKKKNITSYEINYLKIQD